MEALPLATSFLFFFHLFICAYNVWVISAPSLALPSLSPPLRSPSPPHPLAYKFPTEG
jgi:hypothetical protein